MLPGTRKRERVVKACQLCRIRKRKCDGKQPCLQCKREDEICSFEKRKRTSTKTYPPGYVQLLEAQQARLVAGLRILYDLLQTGQTLPGEPLVETEDGYPSTHDLLERLGLLDEPTSESWREAPPVKGRWDPRDVPISPSSSEESAQRDLDIQFWSNGLSSATSSPGSMLGGSSPDPEYSLARYENHSSPTTAGLPGPAPAPFDTYPVPDQFDPMYGYGHGSEYLDDEALGLDHHEEGDFIPLLFSCGGNQAAKLEFPFINGFGTDRPYFEFPGVIAG